MKSYEFEQLNWIDIELMKRVYAVRALRTVMRGLDITDPLWIDLRHRTQILEEEAKQYKIKI